MSELLKQPAYSPVPMEEQVVSFWAATNGYLDEVSISKVVEFEESAIAVIRDSLSLAILYDSIDGYEYLDMEGIDYVMRSYI